MRLEASTVLIWGSTCSARQASSIPLELVQSDADLASERLSADHEADQPRLLVEQRPTARAGVHDDVALDDRASVPGAERADDALRQRMAEALLQRRADREDRTSLVIAIWRGSAGAASGFLSSKVRSSGAPIVAHPEIPRVR